jgi:hypothetical protein
MTSEAANLLRRLGSGVIPDGSGAMCADTAIEGADFPTLLVSAQRGLIRTGRVVEIHAELDPALTPHQLENLADAADLAQAAGAFNVIMAIDGRAMILDVAQRRVTGEIPLDTPVMSWRASTRSLSPGQQPRMILQMNTKHQAHRALRTRRGGTPRI